MGNKNLNKILIVGFEKENQINYPHLKQTIEYLQNKYSSDYIYFSERGYFLNCKFSFSIKKNIKKMYAFTRFLFDISKAIYATYLNNYKVVIAVDNFTYVIYSIFYKKTILWSHDFVTEDQEQAKCFIQKIIKRWTSKYLIKNKKLIIQDSERLSLFLENHMEKDEKYLDIFYFPVSLLPVRRNLKVINNNLPVLMQIGGINSFRSGSDVLIENYQIMHHKYDLLLHGYFMNDISEQIKKSNYLPTSSSIELFSNEVYRIVEKCDIGFICYNTNNKNFYYTKYASGQLTEFLRCGKPVIVMGNTNLKDFVNHKNIGIGINSIEDLESAISNIVNEYQILQENSLKCFKEIYDINLYLNNLGVWIND